LVGKPKGKKSLGRLRQGWKDNFEMNVREMKSEIVGWMHFVPEKYQFL
jgi:hypothetical protein